MPKVYDNTGIGSGPGSSYTRNPPPPPPEPPQAEQKKRSVGGAIAKWLLIAAGGSLVGVYVTKKWDTWFGDKKDGEEGMPPQPSFGYPGMGMPQFIPMPVPYPFQMGGYAPPALPPASSHSTRRVVVEEEDSRRNGRDDGIDPDEDEVYASEMEKYRKRRAKRRAKRDAEVEEVLEDFEFEYDS